jgi:hypothetical protein
MNTFTRSRTFHNSCPRSTLLSIVAVCFCLSTWGAEPQPANGGIALDPSPPPTAPMSSGEPEIPAMPGMPVVPTKAPRHEISASADYFYALGNVTLPFFFSLNQGQLGASGVFPPNVVVPPRDSDYIGAGFSYSPGQAWYFDFSYSHGTGSGNVDVPIPDLGPTPRIGSDFHLEDDSYKAYVRYAFPGLRGRRLSAYLRAGVSYDDAVFKDTTVYPFYGIYTQKDDLNDILGNLGFGLGYSLYSRGRIKLGLQLEGEAFYGHRSQETQETLAGDPGPKVTIDNDLYGGIGRLTGRFQYALGRSGLLKAFADFGLETKYTLIDYSSLGTSSELLWGPYINVGLRYSF